MKKIIGFVLVLCLVLALSVSAFAEAKLSVVDKNLITFSGESMAYFFAKVENIGDAAAYVDYSGKLVGFDAGDDLVITEEYVNTLPSGTRLEPGEYAYIREYILEDSLRTTSIADYKFSIKTDTYGYDYEKLSCEATIEYNPSDIYNNDVYVTFTNNTDETIYEFEVVYAVYDQNGALILVDADTTYNVGVHVGSTVTVKCGIDSDLVKYYAANAITPTTLDAAVYIEK